MEKTLNRVEPASPGRGEGKEDSMEQTVEAVPPVHIVAQGEEEMYYRIFAAAKTAKVYGSDASDVATEAWLIAQQRGYYCPRMLREAARNLGLWRVARETEITIDMPVALPDRDTVAAVRKALGQLSRKARAMVYMYFFRGDTIPQIAAATGDSVGTVHARLRQAEETLRRMLADYAPRARRKSKPDTDLPLFAEVAAGGMR